MTKKSKYYVLAGLASTAKPIWVRCKKAREANKGWLEYELFDGTSGLTPPGKWKKE